MCSESSPIYSFLSFLCVPLPPPPRVPAQHQETGAEREPRWSPAASGGAERHKAAQDTAWQQSDGQGNTGAGALTNVRAADIKTHVNCKNVPKHLQKYACCTYKIMVLRIASIMSSFTSRNFAAWSQNNYSYSAFFFFYTEADHRENIYSNLSLELFVL